MKTAESLKEILRNSMDKYNDIADQDRREVLSKLAPGARAPEAGILHTDKAKAAYNGYARMAKAQALELIDSEIAKVGKAVAAAPSTEAINTLTALSIAKSKDPRDYEAVYAEYGSTIQVTRALNALAKENGVQFRADTSEYDRIDSLNDMKNTFNSFFDDTKAPSAGAIAFIEMDIDAAGID